MINLDPRDKLIEDILVSIITTKQSDFISVMRHDYDDWECHIFAKAYVALYGQERFNDFVQQQKGKKIILTRNLYGSKEFKGDANVTMVPSVRADSDSYMLHALTEVTIVKQPSKMNTDVKEGITNFETIGPIVFTSPMFKETTFICYNDWCFAEDSMEARDAISKIQENIAKQEQMRKENKELTDSIRIK